MADDFLAQKAAFSLLDSVTVETREVQTLNSLNAVESVIRWKRTPRSLTRKLVDGWTGRARDYDALFEAQAATTLRNLHEIVTDIRKQNAESDLVIAKAASRIVQLHERLGVLGGELREAVDALYGEISSIRRDITEIRQDVNEHNARGEIDDALTRLSAQSHGPLALAAVWLELDQLWWGSFGKIVRQAPEGRRAKSITENLLIKLSQLIDARYAGIMAEGHALPMPALLSTIGALDPERGEEIELIALDPSIELRPLTHAIVTRGLGRGHDADEDRMLPRIVSPDSLTDRLFHETKRSTEE